MKVTFKTVTGRVFSLEASEDTTIADVKKQIEAQGEYQAEGMKLVRKGELMADTATLKETGTQESDFIVVVAKKIGAVAPKKKTTPAPTTTPTPAPQPTTTTTPQPTTTQTTPAPQPTTTPAPTSTPAPQTQTTTAPQQTQGMDANRIVTGEAYQQAVQQYLEMGFDQAVIENAMRAAFNNPERALDYIMNGIPEGLQQPQGGQGGNAPTTQQGGNQMDQGGDDEGLYEDEGADFDPNNNPLAALMQQQGGQGGQGGGMGDIARLFPLFNQLRNAIQENPALLQPILQRIAQTNPQLYQVIQQNPQEFIRLLNEAPPQTGGQTGGQQQQGGNPFGNLGAMGGQGGGMGGVGAPPPGTIFVTPQEKLAIDELVSLGFSRMAAAQAYFACDKNQELAANFLLENQYNDEDMQDFSQFGGGQGGNNDNNSQGGNNNNNPPQNQ